MINFKKWFDLFNAEPDVFEVDPNAWKKPMGNFITNVTAEYFGAMCSTPAEEAMMFDKFANAQEDNGKPTAAFTALIMELVELASTSEHPEAFKKNGTELINKYIEKMLRLIE